MARASEEELTQLTHPDRILQFVESCPGLAETCEKHPSILAEQVPLLTLRGMGGRFEKALQAAYEADTACKPDEERWALRSPDFGGCGPYDVMHRFSYCGAGDEHYGTTGTQIVVWLLSNESAWVPQEVRDFLIEGARQFVGWATDTAGFRIYNFIPEWEDYQANGPTPEILEFLRAEIAEACSTVPWQADPEAISKEFIHRDFLAAWLDPESVRSPNRHMRRKGKSDEEVIRALAAGALALSDPSLYQEALEAIVAVCDDGQDALSDESRSRFSLGPRE